ncbi:MAG: hypothetical protein QM723_07720 [Myxococcaceae bacterium]
MQHRYSGDIGDFSKFALLRALAPGRTAGLAWYLCDGAGEKNNDGQHIAYLEQPHRFRHLDPATFDGLRTLVLARKRSVPHLEAAKLVKGVRYHGEVVPRSREDRSRWFAGLQSKLDACDLVMADPDNGFEPATISPKCITWDEIRALRRRGRALLLYHHQTRRAGGAKAEVAHFSRLLKSHGAKSVRAIRFRPFSSRFYFVVDHDAALDARLERFAKLWAGEAELF